jgi:hypothetical protein
VSPLNTHLILRSKKLCQLVSLQLRHFRWCLKEVSLPKESVSPLLFNNFVEENHKVPLYVVFVVVA